MPMVQMLAYGKTKFMILDLDFLGHLLDSVNNF